MTSRRRIVTESPENSETPLAEGRGWLTPNRSFFVRNHFAVPEIDLVSWKLHIGGGVQRELALDASALRSYPQRSVFATLECAGNGRSFLATKSPGVQWGAGAIGHAEWTGVPLRALLDAAGVEANALEVVAVGADSGTEPGHPGPLGFERSLPLAKALHADTLVALAMNGEPLEREHGAPARLVVPGWYGVASVKWLRALEVVAQPFDGHFQTEKYSVRRSSGRGIRREPIGPMDVKSEILGPSDGDVVGPGPLRVFGLAWAGEESVAAVELSCDGGASFSRAEIVGPSAPYSWTLWERRWDVSGSGERSLLARAISSGGRIQRADYDPLCDGYLVSMSRPVTVRIDPARARSQPHDVPLRDEVRERMEERARLPLDLEIELTEGAGI